MANLISSAQSIQNPNYLNIKQQSSEYYCSPAIQNKQIQSQQKSQNENNQIFDFQRTKTSLLSQNQNSISALQEIDGSAVKSELFDAIYNGKVPVFGYAMMNFSPKDNHKGFWKVIGSSITQKEQRQFQINDMVIQFRQAQEDESKLLKDFAKGRQLSQRLLKEQYQEEDKEAQKKKVKKKARNRNTSLKIPKDALINVTGESQEPSQGQNNSRLNSQRRIRKNSLSQMNIQDNYEAKNLQKNGQKKILTFKTNKTQQLRKQASEIKSRVQSQDSEVQLIKRKLSTQTSLGYSGFRNKMNIKLLGQSTLSNFNREDSVDNILNIQIPQNLRRMSDTIEESMINLKSQGSQRKVVQKDEKSIYQVNNWLQEPQIDQGQNQQNIDQVIINSPPRRNLTLKSAAQPGRFQHSRYNSSQLQTSVSKYASNQRQSQTGIMLSEYSKLMSIENTDNVQNTVKRLKLDRIKVLEQQNYQSGQQIQTSSIGMAQRQGKSKKRKSTSVKKFLSFLINQYQRDALSLLHQVQSRQRKNI
eukprot:403363505